MSLRTRLAAMEARLGAKLGKIVPIAWLGPQDTQAAAVIEDLQRRGRRVRLIQFSLMLFAKTEEEAHELIRDRRAAGDIRPITVKGPCTDEAEELPTIVHDDGAPEWLAAKPKIMSEAS